jgi:Fe-S cluster assembly iron-binding protein IscA
MLTLTENASTIVSQILEHQELGESAGLRITTIGDPEPGFEVTPAPQAEPGDQVVEQGGASVYLDATAAEMLDDKVLDASIDTAGAVAFTVADHPG